MPRSQKAQELLDALLVELQADGGDAEIGTMFRSPAIRSRGKIVAFLSFSDSLILKLPEERIAELVDAEVVEPVTMRERTMREWASIPIADDHDEAVDTCLPHAREALAFVRSLEDR